MTHSFMTSNSLSMQQEASKNKKSLRSCDSNRLFDFYMVVVQDYEGEEREYEVEAESFEDASAQVEWICGSEFVDIYNMQIYKLS